MSVFIGIGVMVGIIILASAIARSFFPKGGKGGGKAEWHMTQADRAHRAEALKTYERLASEKLDVIKTAVAMGYSENELSGLDERLEKVIGSEKLKSLLEDGKAPEVDSELLSSDLDIELEKLRKARKRAKG